MADEAVRELSGKLGIDTTDFKTALTSANRELRVLESGFRASAAGLGDWAQDASGLELRIESLTKQLDIQRTKVAALQGEYERVAAEKGKNSRAAQDLQIKLNKETETLGKMNLELGKSETALDGMGDESRDTEKNVEGLRKQEDRAEKSTKTLGNRVRELGSRMNAASGKIRSFAAGIAKLAVGMAVGLVGAIGAVIGALVGLAAATIGPASDLAETVSKIRVVFGDAAEDVLAFGKNSATAMGMSENAALSAAGTYGNLFRSMGISTDASKDMSLGLVQLAADLASFNNMDPTEVLEKLRAGLTGETEPLKVLGVNLSAAAIEARALEMGFEKVNGVLPPAAKAQAAYALILEQTALAQGDFARTAAGDANQSRIFAAQIENLRAKIGAGLLPIVERIKRAINEWLSSPAVQQGIETFTRALSILGDAIGSLLSGNVDLATSQFGAFGATLAKMFGASPKQATQFALNIVKAIKGAIGGISNLVKGIATFMTPIIGFLRDQLIPAVAEFITGQLIPFVQAHGPAIKGAIAGIAAAFAVIGVVIPVVAGVIAALTSPITLIVAAIALLGAAWAGNWGGIQEKVAAVWAFLQPIFQAIWVWLKDTLGKAIQSYANLWTQILQPAMQVVGNFITGTLIPILGQIWAWLAENVPAALQTLSDFWTGTLLPAITAVWEWVQANLIPLFESLGELIGVTLSLALTALAGLWENVLQPALETVWKFIQDKVIPIFEDIWEFIDENVMPILRDLADFLEDTLVKAWNGITGAIQGVIKWIDDLVEKFKNIKLPEWLTPGSPTPLEMGLRGIAKAARQLTNNEMRRLSEELESLKKAGASLTLGGAGALAGAGAGAGAQTIVNQYITAYTPLDYEKIARRVTEIQNRRSR